MNLMTTLAVDDKYAKPLSSQCPRPSFGSLYTKSTCLNRLFMIYIYITRRAESNYEQDVR